MATVELINFSRFGLPNHYAGDRWLVIIKGATPNKTVSINAQRNDFGWSESAYGTTDGTGSFYLLGSWGNADVGHWQEEWKVDGSIIGTLTLDVLPSPYPLWTEDPIPIVEGIWHEGVAPDPFFGADLNFNWTDVTTKYAFTADLFVGMAVSEQMGLAWNLSTSTGWPQTTGKPRRMIF